MSEENQNTDPVEPAEGTEEQEPEELEQDESQEDESDDEADGDFDRERVLRKIKKINSENRNLRQREKDAEERAKQAEDKSEQVQALEASNARYEALADNGLPLKLAKWISATEPDQILEQAEELLSLGAADRQAPPTDAPREKSSRVRNQAAQGDEIGNLDDFAKSIYSN